MYYIYMYCTLRIKINKRRQDFETCNVENPSAEHRVGLLVGLSIEVVSSSVEKNSLARRDGELAVARK